MSADRRSDSFPKRKGDSGPDDGFLIAGILGGDAAAFRKLMDRYDRLVRYTVFRVAKDHCVADPDWLDSVAGDTWTGFVESMRRDPENKVASVPAYLTRIARNRAISAVRQAGRGVNTFSLDSEEGVGEVASTLEQPTESLERVELLGVMRECLHELDPDDQAMASQLQAITERQWRIASEALGVSESTLRSRWKRVLDRLRSCIARKTGKNLAQPGSESDP